MSRFVTMLEDVEIIKADKVIKHGSHDQKTHGSWAIGVSLEVASEIQRYTREWGGLSISMVDGHMPTKGYMVAKPPEFGKIVDEADFFDPIKGPKIMSQYMREQKADLATGKNYLGTWLKDGKIYLDVSENIMGRDKATRLGRERNQKAIWDVVNQTEIDTGGTGRVEKRNQDGGVEEPRRYDGRGDRRLRFRSLEKVRGERQEVQVIRFEYGLKPIFKHEGGEGHDQKTHGNWAEGRTASDWEKEGYSPEEAKRIERMQGRGPTIEELNNLSEEGLPKGIDYDRAREMIDNEPSFNDDVESRIEVLYEVREAQQGSELSEADRLSIYDELRDEAIRDMIEEFPGTLKQFARDQGYGSLVSSTTHDNMVKSFDKVFGMMHEGTFRTGEKAGESALLRSEVTEVEVDSNGAIHVFSRVYDDNGGEATTRPIERVFTKDPQSGTWSVEHEWMQLNDEYKGTGFGSKFIQQSEDWYISKGLTHINTLAGLEDGARHWANAGFDWDRDKLDTSVSRLTSAVTQEEYKLDQIESKFGAEVANNWRDNITVAKNMLSRMVDENGKIKDMRNDDFPKPSDFARLGASNPIKSGSETSWFGKSVLYGRALSYTKALTAEGRNLLNGPIDMDGDGLVYDGTPREKPAPSGNN